jgi:hypothetical protein
MKTHQPSAGPVAAGDYENDIKDIAKFKTVRAFAHTFN